MDFTCTLTDEEQRHMAPELLVGERMHEHVSAKIALQYEAAIRALAQGGCNAARGLALAALRNRGHEHARDLHSAFTNSALTHIIIAAATIMHAAQVANAAPTLTPEIAAVAKHHLQEARINLSSIRTSTDARGIPLITASTGSDAGTAVRENMVSLEEAAANMIECIDCACATRLADTRITATDLMRTSSTTRSTIVQTAAARMV